jgi:hypothetical protein
MRLQLQEFGQLRDDHAARDVATPRGVVKIHSDKVPLAEVVHTTFIM